jgi:hypothetical protein
MVASRMIILKHILEKYGMAVWNGFNWLRIWCCTGLQLQRPHDIHTTILLIHYQEHNQASFYLTASLSVMTSQPLTRKGERDQKKKKKAPLLIVQVSLHQLIIQWEHENEEALPAFSLSKPNHAPFKEEHSHRVLKKHVHDKIISNLWW